MSTSEEKTNAALEALKEGTRDAHAAIKDLRAAIREAHQVSNELVRGAQIAIQSRLEPVVKAEIEELSRATREAMDESVDKVAREFGRLEALYLGTDKDSRKKGEPSLEDLILRKKEADDR